MASSCILFDLKKKGRESQVKFSSARDVEVVEPQISQGYLIGPCCSFCGALTLPPPRHQLCSLPAELLVPLQQQHLNSAADNDTPQSRHHQELHADWATIETRATCTSAGP